MTTADIHLSPSQAARKLGVTPKALRLYERHGLVKPIRAANGWRAYGTAEMTKLHQVLALKGLGLPLKQIAVLLAGRFAALDAVLELQEALLRRQSDRLGRALTLVQSARNRLASGASLSIDDLTHLTMETTMTANPTAEELKAAYQTVAAKHFSSADQVVLTAHGYGGMHVPDAAWEALHQEAAGLMEAGDPRAPDAMDLARRWMAKVFEATGGDPALTQKMKAVAREAHEQPAFAAVSSSANAMMDFIARAYSAAIAANIMPKPDEVSGSR